MDLANTDPLRCLRCSAIGIGVWSIIYCLAQLGLLGWQVQVVKNWQWYWENRELPATGAIDQYQARFPGLYAIYTETPERRRVNAMYAIVLICLGLTIVHLPFSAAMLYGSMKRLPNWMLPWFFTSAPLILLCTTYSVLWWSGDIFNEQLTFSVFEFAMSLAINGVCFVVVFLYYQRLRGKLVYERAGNSGQKSSHHLFVAHANSARDQRQSLRQQQGTRLEVDPNLPPWIETLPDKPPPAIERKLRRKERKEWEMQQKLASKSKKEQPKSKRTVSVGFGHNVQLTKFDLNKSQNQ